MNLKEIFFSKEGTIGRLDYLKATIVLVLAQFIITFLLNSTLPQFGKVVVAVMMIINLILLYTPAVKRYRDTDSPSWYYFLALIPIINLYFALYLLLLKQGKSSSDN